MSSATNRTERLATALKESRPDFTLHNARVFARAVIEAPEGTFGAKPLRYLPQKQSAASPRRSSHERAHDLSAAGVSLPSRAELLRDTGNGAQPVAVVDARPGDLVVAPMGERSLYLGNGQVLMGDADQEPGEDGRTWPGR